MSVDYLYRCKQCKSERNYTSPVGDIAPGHCETEACTGIYRRVWSANINTANLRGAR